MMRSLVNDFYRKAIRAGLIVLLLWSSVAMANPNNGQPTVKDDSANDVTRSFDIWTFLEGQTPDDALNFAMVSANFKVIHGKRIGIISL